MITALFDLDGTLTDPREGITRSLGTDSARAVGRAATLHRERFGDGGLFERGQVEATG